MWLALFLCRIGLERLAKQQHYLGEGYTCVSVERLASEEPHRVSASALARESSATLFVFVFILVVFLAVSYFFSLRIHQIKKNM